jgi:hypothetical protein
MLYNSSKDNTKNASVEQVELHIHYGHVYAEKLRAARAIHLINENDYPKPKQLAKDLAKLSIVGDFR